MLTSAEHDQARLQAKERRNAAAQARRGDGFGFRKVPIAVQVLKTVDAAGAPLMLATSDVPSEQGRYFRVTFERETGKYRCSCGAFRSLSGCHHIGHMAATAQQGAA